MVSYEPCPSHSMILLPVAQRRGERHLCYLCAQDARRVTYAAQKQQAEIGLASRLGALPGADSSGPLQP
jgi:hypothetical protein